MKRLMLTCSVLFLLSAAPATAQDQKNDTSNTIVPHFTTGQITPTPEMWFYQEDLRQYQDPKAAVRQKAEYRSAQRQQRMAALKWYGFSNQRPMASTDPFHSDYSPKWTGPAVNYPNRWYQSSRPWVVIRPMSPAIY